MLAQRLHAATDRMSNCAQRLNDRYLLNCRAHNTFTVSPARALNWGVD